MTHNRLMITYIAILMLGCGSAFEEESMIEPIPVHELQEKRSHSLAEGGPAGTTCADGCIWSLFSVAIGAQNASHDCDGFACACVLDGYAHQACGVESVPEPSNALSTDENMPLGELCAPGCIWSTFAVAIGAQNESAQCETGPCACVVRENVYVECVRSNQSDSWADSSSPSAVDSRNASPPTGQPRADVPYFYQYENELAPSATCQNTSMAMVLAHYGWQGVPDDITGQYGRHYAQSPAGLADLFNQIAGQNGIHQRLRHHSHGSMDDVRSLLDQGKPVIIHGYFTGFGHVVVITGYDAQGYYVHDPAGRWSEVFKGGYGGGSGSTMGRDIYYRKAAFEAAVATSDGWNHMPVWYHEVR